MIQLERDSIIIHKNHHINRMAEEIIYFNVYTKVESQDKKEFIISQ